MTLAEYFHAVYQPSRGLAMNYRMAHENAIRTFNRFAGEELHVEQITPTLLAMFNDWTNAKQGYSRHTSMMYRRIMRNLLSAAAPERFAPPPSIEQEQREDHRRKVEPAPLPAPPVEAMNGSLTPEDFFFRMVYSRLSEKARREYTAAMRAFTLFKPDLPIGRVTPEIVAEFQDWCIARGIALQRSQNDFRFVRAVLNDFHGVRRFGRETSLASGEWGRLEDSPLWEFFFTVYRRRKLPTGSAKTVEKYRWTIARLSELVGEPAGFQHLTEDNVSELMQRQIDAGKAPSTANGERAKLLALAKYAVYRGKLHDAPDVPKLPEHKRLPVAWTPEQVGKLLDSCEQVRGRVAYLPANLWWTGLCMVLFDSGARLGAILKAKLVDLDLQERTLFVTAENQKHKADQLFHLHADTTAVLAKLVEADPVRELLFPWNASESTLFNRYSRILQRAGLPAGRRFKFHALRRTHASLVSRAAGLEAAQRALGHSSSDLTAESYVDPTQDRTVDLLPRPVRKGVA